MWFEYYWDTSILVIVRVFDIYSINEIGEIYIYEISEIYIYRISESCVNDIYKISNLSTKLVAISK